MTIKERIAFIKLNPKMTIQELAQHFNLSESTVASYRSKAGVKNERLSKESKYIMRNMDMSAKELSAKLGLTPNQIRMRKHLLKKRLSKKIEPKTTCKYTELLTIAQEKGYKNVFELREAVGHKEFINIAEKLKK